MQAPVAEAGLAPAPAAESIRARARDLLAAGAFEDSLRLWADEVERSPETIEALRALSTRALTAPDLWLAGEYAKLLAALRWGRPETTLADRARSAFPVRPPDQVLSVAKLRHDAQQFAYLRRLGVLGDDYDPVIQRFEAMAERLSDEPRPGKAPLEGADLEAVGRVYGRLVHLRPTPRVDRALSDSWKPRAVEDEYLGQAPGVVVIDDFLTPEALQAVRAFCLESTVWNTNRYAHGRLGAFLNDGFNCPLLLQIAEELRQALPRVIGHHHPLRQLWGFKNSTDLPPGVTTHADFAAVNVNFWITPDDANLDPRSGGMDIYGLDAPQHWNFHAYNGRADLIRSFLHDRSARPTAAPYRQNRAVVFNSDLFHATQAVTFRPDYENKRINITMLYGDRSDDRHHAELSAKTSVPSVRSWRSAAFRGTRRRA